MIVAVPADTAVTLPLSLTVATSGSSLLQLTFGLVASSGSTVAVRVVLSPSFSSSVSSLKVTPVTSTVTGSGSVGDGEGLGSASVTVTSQIASKFPSSVSTVIVAVPADTAVTLPLSLTVATSGSSLLQLTFGLVASSGSTVAVRVALSPSFNSSVSSLKVTPVTSTVTGSGSVGLGLGSASVTVTSHVASKSPSSVTTVIVAVPADTAVTLPLALTVATSSSLLLQITFLFVAPVGFIDAVRVSLSPSFNSSVSLSSVTPITSIPLTVTGIEADDFPSDVFTVTTVVPSATGVSSTPSPDSLTVTMLSSPLLQMKVGGFSGSGITVASRYPFVPMHKVIEDIPKEIFRSSASVTVTSQSAV